MPIISPKLSTGSIDTTSIDAAIKQLKDNETTDDATVTALEALLKAKDTDLDKAIADLKTRVDAIPTTIVAPKAEIDTIYDPLTAPQTVIPVQALNGATVVSGATGSVMVNGGKVHTFGRTSTPPAPNTWTGNLTIAPTVGSFKLRFGITSSLPGTIEVSIDGAAPLTALNTGLGWSSVTPAIAVFADNGFNWFEVPVTATGNAIALRVTIPTGRGLLPCIYAADAITSLIPTTATGLTLRSMPSGTELSYRPGELAKKTDLATIAPLYSTIATKAELALIQGKPLELRGCLEDNRVYLWRSPTIDRLQKTWASGLGRGAFSVSATYPQRVGSGWIPQDVSYVPNPAWQAAGNLNLDGNAIYTCKLTSGAITSISYDFSDPADINVFGSVSYDAAAISSWGDSSYWGGKTNFGSAVLSSGRTVKPITCIRDDGSLLLSSMNTAGTVTGSVRNVRVNGMAVDVLTLPEQTNGLSDRVGVLEKTPAAIVSYKTETLLDTTPSLTSETYLQLTNVPAGNYFAFFRLTMNITTVGSRQWCCGVGINNAAVNHPGGTHAVVSITSDTYTTNYPHVANGSTPITLPNTTNTVEVKGQLYGTDHATGESIVHGHLTLIKL